MAAAVGKAAGKVTLEVVGKEVGEAIDKERSNLIDTMIVNITGGVSNTCHNVFGEPITNATVKKLMPELKGKITNLHRARLALAVKKSKGRFDAACDHVKMLKKQMGNGVSTLCLVYNASGDAITLATNYDWFGQIGRDPYPTHIGNGQWAAFLHEKKAMVASGSVAAVVYRGKIEANSCFEYDWMLAWHNPWLKINQNNTVLTEICEAGQYDNNLIWGRTENKLEGGRSTCSAKYKGGKSTASIGSYTSPTLIAVLTVDGA